MSFEQLFAKSTPQQILKLVRAHFPDRLEIYYINTADDYDSEEVEEQTPEEMLQEQIKQYEHESEILFDDLYLESKRIEVADLQKKKRFLMQLMRYIDAQLAYIRKSWPDTPIKEETLARLNSKYEIYDDMYDELLII